MIPYRRPIAVAGLVAVLAGCAGDPPAAPPPAEDLEGAATQVTLGRSGADRDPEPSKDGAMIFYASTSFGASYDLYVKTLGTNTVRQVTRLEGDERFPKINPANPRVLAFCSNGRGSWEICIAKDWMSAPEQAVSISEPGATSIHPTWSPDGRSLAWCSTEGGPADPWRIRIRDLSTGETRVLEDIEGLLPEWSPKGDRLVFQRMRQRDGWMSALWTMEIRSGAVSNVTCLFEHDDWAAINPSWSPDGRHVVFSTVGKSRARTGVIDAADDVWTIPVEGGSPTRVTTSPAADWLPAWSTNGRIYFVSDRSGSGRIWSLAAPVTAPANGDLPPAEGPVTPRG